MICKEDFLDIMMSFEHSYIAIKKMEDAMGLDLDESPLIDFIYKSDVIAMNLLCPLIIYQIPEVVDNFLSSFWKLVDNDIFVYTLSDLEEVTIHNSEEFYDFWNERKEDFPVHVERFMPKRVGDYKWQDGLLPIR